MQARPLRRRGASVVLAGEDPARERDVGDEADPEPLTCRQELPLGSGLQPGVLALLGHERRQSPLGRDRVRLLDHLRGEVGGADRAHGALLDELVQRLQRLLERRHAVRAVVLVEVDPVGAEPAQ